VFEPRWADRLLQAYVTCFVATLAVWAVVAQIGVQLGITFALVPYLIAASVLVGVVLTGWLLRLSRPPSRPPAQTDPFAAAPNETMPAPALGAWRRFGLAWLGGAALLGASLVLAGQGASLAFATALIFALAAVVWLGYVFWRPESRPEAQDQSAPVAPAWGADILVLGLALCIALLPLLLHRTDFDDAAFLNLSVGMMSDPRAILTFDAMLGDPAQPVLLPTYRVEVHHALMAGLAALTGLEVIAVAHLVWPVLAALALFAAFYLFAREFAGALWWLALLLALVVLFADGSVHRSFGNFSLMRLQQGKSLVFIGIVPLIFVAAARFWHSGTLRDWVFLALVQAAATGLSANALFICPLALFVVGTGLWLGRPSQFGRYVVLGLSGIWPVVAGAMILLSTGALASEFLEVPGIQADLRAVFGRVWALALLPTLFAGVVLLSGWVRKVFAGSLLIYVLLTLNPLLDPVLAKGLTGNLNWRLSYIIPMPGLLGVIGAVGLATLLRSGRIRPGLLMGAAVVALGVVSLSPSSIFSPARRVFVAPLSLDVPRYYDNIAALRAALPPAPQVLAPKNAARWLATFADPPAQVAVREVYLDHYRHTRPVEEIALRRAAFTFIETGAHDAGAEALAAESIPAELARYTEAFGVNAVVVPRRNPRADAIIEAAQGLGFAQAQRFGAFTLLKR